MPSSMSFSTRLVSAKVICCLSKRNSNSSSHNKKCLKRRSNLWVEVAQPHAFTKTVIASRVKQTRRSDSQVMIRSICPSKLIA